MEKNQLSETFDFEKSKSIMQSNIITTEKKIHLRVLKKEIEDQIKKIKKVYDREPGFIPHPIHLILLFLVFYIPTQSLSFAISIWCMLMVFYHFRFMFQGNKKGEMAKAMKALEKETKTINDYIKIIDQSEL